MVCFAIQLSTKTHACQDTRTVWCLNIKYQGSPFRPNREGEGEGVVGGKWMKGTRAYWSRGQGGLGLAGAHMGQAVHHHLVLPLDLPQPCLTMAEILALQLLGLAMQTSVLHQNRSRCALRCTFFDLLTLWPGNHHHQCMALLLLSTRWP